MGMGKEYSHEISTFILRINKDRRGNTYRHQISHHALCHVRGDPSYLASTEADRSYNYIYKFFKFFDFLNSLIINSKVLSILLLNIYYNIIYDNYSIDFNYKIKVFSFESIYIISITKPYQKCLTQTPSEQLSQAPYIGRYKTSWLRALHVISLLYISPYGLLPFSSLVINSKDSN
jgi:hypothetical protein